MWSTPRNLATAFAIFCALTAVFGGGSLLDHNSSHAKLGIFAFTASISFLLACVPVAVREFLVGRWLRATIWLLGGVVLAVLSVWAAASSAVAIGNDLVVFVGIPRGLLVILAVISLLWASSRRPATWPQSGTNVSTAQWYKLLRRILKGYYGWSGKSADEAVAIVRDQVASMIRRTPSELDSDMSTLTHPAEFYGEAWQVAAEFADDTPRRTVVSPRLVFFISSGFLIIGGGLLVKGSFATGIALVSFAVVLAVFGAFIRRSR